MKLFLNRTLVGMLTLYIIIISGVSYCNSLADNYIQQATKYQYSGQTGKAATEYKKALIIEPTNETAALNLFVIYNKNNQPESAFETLEKAIIARKKAGQQVSTLQHYYVATYWGLIKTLVENGEYGEALALHKSTLYKAKAGIFNKYDIVFNKSDIFIYQNLAVELCKNQDRQGVLKVIQKIKSISNDPRDTDGLTAMLKTHCLP